MTLERDAGSAIGFGTGISDDHRDGIRWVDYRNISWNPVFCKRCDICVEICPKNTLVLRNDAIVEEENCILCGLCERYCPDLAIEMIPAAVRSEEHKYELQSRQYLECRLLLEIEKADELERAKN